MVGISISREKVKRVDEAPHGVGGVRRTSAVVGVGGVAVCACPSAPAADGPGASHHSAGECTRVSSSFP